MKRIISIITLLLVFTLPLFAQGEATAVFLGIAPGGRSGGMGETGVAHANNANATFYNAALLAWQYDEEYGYGEKPFQANLMHAKWLPKFNFEDLYYDYVAARYYLEDFGMISASLTYLNLGENEWTDITTTASALSPQMKWLSASAIASSCRRISLWGRI
jgi:hypothetical protein